jgi:hypothetical protein
VGLGILKSIQDTLAGASILFDGKKAAKVSVARVGERPGALWVDQQTLAFHFFASKIGEFAGDAGQNRGMAAAPSLLDRKFEIQLSSID